MTLALERKNRDLVNLGRVIAVGSNTGFSGKTEALDKLAESLGIESKGSAQAKGPGFMRKIYSQLNAKLGYPAQRKKQ